MNAPGRDSVPCTAVQIDAAAPHPGHPGAVLVDEAHTAALQEDAARDQLRWENERRDQLNQAAWEGRNSPDPAARARWLARDESWTRSCAPVHDGDEF